MDRSAGLVVFLVLFAVYVGTGSPAVSWFDTGELAAGAFLLGNGHPPGQPLYALIAKGATFLPAGSVAFRLTLLSAACGAAAVALLPGLSGRLLARLEMPETPRGILWLLVPWAGLALPVWLQNVRVELYATQLLLSVLAVRVALASPGDEGGRAARAMTLGLLLGLSGATHPLLGVLLVPGLFLLVGRPAIMAGAGMIAAAVAGGSAYLYLPIRARAGALLNWGDPGTWERFWYVVTGKAYQHSFATLTLDRWLDNLELHAALFAGLLGVPLLVLAAVGIAICFKRFRVGAGLVLLLAGNLASTSLQSAFFPDNPDALGYLSLATALLFVLAAVGLAGISERALQVAPRRHVRAVVIHWVARIIAVFLGCVVAAEAWPRPDLHGNWYYHAYIVRLLRPLPPGCLDLSGSDASTFASWYGLAVEGMRPDIGVVSLYTLPDSAVFRLGNPPSIPYPTGNPGPGGMVRALVDQALPRRPIRMTMHDLPVDLSAEMRIDLAVFRLLPASAEVPLDDGLDELEAFWLRQARRLGRDPGYRRDRQARLRYPSHLESVGDHLRRMGLLEPALRVYRVAEQLAPDPYRLVHLKRLRVEQLVAEIGLEPRGSPGAGTGESTLATTGGDMVRVRKLLELGKRQAARGLLARLPLEDPRAVLARAWLAYLEGRWGAARERLEHLRQERPFGDEARVALTRLERVLSAAGAVEWMEEYVKRRPSAEVMAALANRLREAGRTGEAVKVASRAVAEDSSLVAAHVALGWALVARGRLEEAFGAVTRGLERDPTDPVALRLASYLYRRGLR